MSEADYNRLKRPRNDLPGQSHRTYTIPSDSDSDDIQHLVRKRKRPLPAYECSTDSDSSLPRLKIPASPSPTVKMFSDIKSLLSDYHREVVHLRLERELEDKRPSVYMIFSCLICKDVPAEEAAPLVPPCCRAAVVCHDCMDRWLESQPSCPHCREPLTMDRCDKLPILRPLFDFLAEHN